MIKEITGWHVLGGFLLGFGVIVGVNLFMAFNAISTFPGVEARNSYVASQTFDADRKAQEALGWDVSARVEQGNLWVEFDKDGAPVQPEIEKAIFGRATNTQADQTPVFAWTGERFVAPVKAGGGNWNLRLEARAGDGTLFKQRIVVEVVR